MNKQNRVTEVNSCRVCNSDNLVSVLSLGEQYPNDFVTGDIALNPDDKVPLDLVICAENDCGLLQLKHTYSRVALYENYWFRSSVNETMIKALEDITENEFYLEKTVRKLSEKIKHLQTTYAWVWYHESNDSKLQNLKQHIKRTYS